MDKCKTLSVMNQFAPLLATLLLLTVTQAYAQNPPQRLPDNENPYANLNPQSDNPYIQMNKDQNDNPLRDDQLFNHMSLGVVAGGGIGVQLAAPCTPYMQLRGGYVHAPKFKYTYQPSSFTSSVGLDALVADAQVALKDELDREVDMSGVGFAIKENLGGGYLMLDLFPSKDGGFHFSAGAFLTKQDLLNLDIIASGVLLPNEYGSVSLTLNQETGARVSSDMEGIFHLNVLSQNKLRPYLGIGFGRAVNMYHRLSFTFDVGVVYTGSLSLQTVNYANPDPGDYGHPNPNYRSGNPPYEIVPITSSTIVDENGTPLDHGYIDQYSRIPVMPLMTFGLHFRFM